MTEQKIRILIVDDEEVVRESLAAWFADDGYEVSKAPNGKAAIEKLRDQKFDLALIDIKMPGMDGLELQDRIIKIDPDLTIIIMTAYASVQTSIEAMKKGAYDYILKPFDPDQLAVLVRNAVERKALVTASKSLEIKVQEEASENSIIGDSQAIKHIVELVEKVSQTDSTVLILGESGTGKELVARNIHAMSSRCFMPMVTVNCGALAEGILESELFGHEKGAFTGAQYRKKGRFELADGGTIFLDEIGDISAKTQSDLLRVLEEKRITRVGGAKEIEVDFRVISATNRNLDHFVEEGLFRGDLFYRLNVFTINIPPLRDRPEDIMILATHFLGKFNESMNRKVEGFTRGAKRMMVQHTWPGNIRELENSIERAMVLCGDTEIDLSHLPFHAGDAASESDGKSLDEMEKTYILNVLIKNNWNISRAAKILEIDRVTLYNRMKKYGFERPDGK